MRIDCHYPSPTLTPISTQDSKKYLNPLFGCMDHYYSQSLLINCFNLKTAEFYPLGIAGILKYQYLSASSIELIYHQFINPLDQVDTRYYRSIVMLLLEHQHSIPQYIIDELSNKDALFLTQVLTTQHCSEQFIKTHINTENQQLVKDYQFFSGLSRQLKRSCWINKPSSGKKKYIRENTPYQWVGNDHLIAYKATRKKGISTYKPYIQYIPGNNYYINHVDCNRNVSFSFGLSAGVSKDWVSYYYPEGEVYQVKIPIDQIGCVTKINNTIRCYELEVLDRL